MRNNTNYIFEDDPSKQRERIKIAYAKVMRTGGGVVIAKETLEKYRGIYSDPAVKLAVNVREYYKENLQGKTVNVDIKNGVVEVGFGADGRTKSTGNRMTEEKASTFEHLETLLRTSVYAYSQKNRETATNVMYAEYVPQFHYLINNVNINDVDIPVKIQVREMNMNGETLFKYYTHGFIKN